MKKIFKMRSRSVVNNFRIILLSSVFILTSLCVFSQTAGTINIEKIRERKVRKFITSRNINMMHDFSTIHASCSEETDESGYYMHEKVFFLEYDLDDVWNSYLNFYPGEIWNRKSVRFGLLISKYLNSVKYSNNITLTKVDTGQVYFLNLRVFKGLFNIPVAFEVIRVDQASQVVEFSYLDDNKTRGKQVIEFFDDGDGKTRIVHRSYYSSGSSLRDNLLYPLFHKKFISEFHRNLRDYIEGKSVTALMQSGII